MKNKCLLSSLFLFLSSTVNAISPNDYNILSPISLSIPVTDPVALPIDFTGDGADDLIVWSAALSGGPATLYLVPRTGAYSFGAPVSVPAPNTPGSRGYQFDGLSGQDLPLLPVFDQTWVVPVLYSQNGNNLGGLTFFPFTTITAASEFSMLALNANGDAAVDLMASIDGNTFATLLGNGSGGFSETGNLLSAPNAVKVSRPTGDFLSHIFTFSQVDPINMETLFTTEILAREFVGSDWGSPTLLSAENSLSTFPLTLPITSGDFDGDGRNDLLTTAAGLTIYTQTNGGQLSPTSTLIPNIPADTLIVVEDLDLDGDTDFVAVASGETGIMNNPSNGNFNFNALGDGVGGNFQAQGAADLGGSSNVDLYLVRNAAADQIELVIAAFGIVIAPIQPLDMVLAKVPGNLSSDANNDGLVDVADVIF